MNSLFQTKVHRNGIKFQGIYYRHPALNCYQDTDVIILLNKKRKLKIFNLSGQLICKALPDGFTEEKKVT